MITDYFDRVAVGDVDASKARTITETDIVTFAMLTGDWHPVHTDVEYAAAEERFGQRIAHGALVLSVALGLATLWPKAMKAFYGIDELRFVNPTFIGDTLHVETEVTAVEPRNDNSGIVVSNFVVRKQNGDVVLAASLRCLVVGSPQDGSGA